MSYWEYFKRAKELVNYLPLKHPQRVSVEKAMNKILMKMNEIEEGE